MASFNHTLQVVHKTPAGEMLTTKALSGDGQFSRDVIIPATASDVLVSAAIDIDQVQLLTITSDQDVLLETNDGTTPTDSFTIKADVAFVWTPDMVAYFTNPITADVTALYFSNAGSSAARVRIECVSDSTP